MSVDLGFAAQEATLGRNETVLVALKKRSFGRDKFFKTPKKIFIATH